MTTDVPAPTRSDHAATVEEKIEMLRRLFADAPEVGRTALENVLKRLASDASQSRRRQWRARAGSGAGWARSPS